MVALDNLEPGNILSKKNIFLKRHGGGDFGIDDLEKLYGKTVMKKIKINTQIKKNSIKIIYLEVLIISLFKNRIII